MNTKIIYQFFDKKLTQLRFPYPPVYTEKDADYVCFSIDKDITSKAGKMIYVDSYDEGLEEIKSTLAGYTDKMLIETNQIQTGPLFDEAFEAYIRLVTVPEYDKIPDITFDINKMIPTCDENGNYIYKKNPTYTGGKYEGREYLLTVGMPVSNQIGTIDRCLSHIKPILDELDAELVVVDTGSVDGTIEVCMEYGARVINFPWCNNMSAARNMAINNAKGLWYMSIDDDEWFEDVSDIIDFFKTGRYKKVVAATYVQRNYMSVKHGNYSDVPALRIAKITPELHFEGRIHDGLVVSEEETIVGDSLTSCAKHEGFARDDMDKVRAKFKRNTASLLYDVCEYPLNVRYNYQLANEFNVVERYDEAAIFFFRGLSIEMEIGRTFISNHHASALISTAYNNRMEEVFYLIDLLGDRYPYTIAERGYFEHAKADMGIRYGRSYEEVMAWYNGYLDCRKKFDKDPKDSRANTYTGLYLFTDEAHMNAAHVIPFCAHMSVGKEEEALKELELLEARSMFDEWHPVYQCVHMCSGEAYKARLKKLNHIQRGQKMPHFVKGFFRYIDKYEPDIDIISRLEEVLSFYNIENMQKFLIEHAWEIEGIFWDKVGTPSNIKILENDANISLQLRYMYAHMLKVKFATMDKGAESMDLFLRYVRATSEYAKRFYHPSILEDWETEVITPEIKAAHMVWSGCSETDILKMVKLLKKALEIYPSFHHEIKELLGVLNV